MAQYVMAPMRRRTSLMTDDRPYARSNASALHVKIKLDDEDLGEDDKLEEDESNEYVNLNVGGVLFRTSQRTLSNISDTKLSNLQKSDPNYNAAKDEYFFDRNSAIFPWILDCFRHREMHIPRSFCAVVVQDELLYWGLKDSRLSDCCMKTYLDSLDEIATNEILLREFNEIPMDVYAVESSINGKSSCRTIIWNFMDKPQSSRWAQVWSYAYLTLTALSILTFFIETLPEGRVRITHDNGTFVDTDISNHKIRLLVTTEPHPALMVIDVFCMIFFSIEFIVRLIVCPRRRRLMGRAMTVFDLLYLIPVWLTTTIYWIDRDFWRYSSRILGFLVLQAFKVLRVFRIFRVMQYFRGLRILWLAVKASVRELILLAMFILLAITIFACFIYCAEIFNENSFDNAVIGLWWALITMTTVGYGDFFPESWPGYIVGGVCALTGIILIGMPVPIIASNFHAYYGLRIPVEQDKEVPQQKHIPIRKRKVSPIRPV
ncbi:potassium voltage-gated channel subfamily C member 3-like [Mizuhopecten yessoensis]|uniref:Potassium voltage-gated channel protein Shaw n=1 Tax=Mizuhopecten yessoensis TaxID=6573 RepID=A0A210QYC2_MIZYE|nr:potassium voltage-gated channel subfamily C member 3-like [Mizuhopecten yessoensis]OWF53702.1 Potassium voltage-gated channel protein Shaw [Mizuhopecten yessoensis]